MSAREELRDRRDHALHDLAELAEQVREGEIDEATAADLRRSFEHQAAGAIRALEAETEGDGSSGPSGRWMVAMSVLAIGAVAAAVVLVPRFTDLRPEGGFVTGNEAVTGAAATSGRDLSQVTNEEMEAVVADNPDVVPMRLRLAHRYFEAEELARAVDHYQEVLDREPHPEAMSHLGWILFLDGDAELALQLIEASVERDPDDPEARWMQANVLVYGVREPAAAVPILEALLARDDLRDQRTEVTEVLTDARASLETP